MNKMGAHQTGNGFHGDTVKLAEELGGKIRGEVSFDLGSRALYAADGSNYREVPIGIVLPRDVEDVIQTILIANRTARPSFHAAAARVSRASVATLRSFWTCRNTSTTLSQSIRRNGSVSPGLVSYSTIFALMPRRMGLRLDPIRRRTIVARLAA